MRQGRRRVYRGWLLRLEIGRQISQMHIVVAAGEKDAHERCKYPRLVSAEVIGGDQVQCRLRLHLVLVVPAWTIPVAAAGHLICGQPEQEEILLPGFLRHLDGSAVACTQGQCSIHHKFHIARAAGFVAGC